MGKNMTRAITDKLFCTNKTLFFKKLLTDKGVTDISFIVTRTNKITSDISMYELKDEYKEMMQSLSFSDVVEILQSGKLQKDVSIVKYCCLGFVGIAILNIVFYLIIFASIL